MGKYFTLADVASLANLAIAARKARRGKSRKPDVEVFHLREESHLLTLHDALLDGTWRPGPARQFIIHEPKRRLISAAPYADRVVHHALCHLLEPLLARRFHPRSFSCQTGKGTRAARECVRKLVNAHRYVLKCDVRKFFESIDHAVLREKLFRVVHCPGVRALMCLILDSHATPAQESCCGLPLGNLTSQLWANFYLDSLDHWINTEMKFGAYARYTDDFLIFNNDKAALWDLHAAIITQLTALRLQLAMPKSKLMQTDEGVPFCGFVFRPGLRPRVLGATKRRFEQRRSRLARSRDIFALSQAVVSWYAFSREGNTVGLRRAYAHCAH